MHTRAEVQTETRRWAALAGLIAGFAGVAISDLAARLVAPLGSPVTAVGELIIRLLPGPLVNFGKETLGFADKPILIGLVVVGVLALCALAGRLELGRRWAGALVFAPVAILGWVAISVRAQGNVNAYIPSLVGLLIGYMILSTLILRLRRWQSPRTSGPASSPARRDFLAKTILFGALAAVAGIGGRVLAGATQAVSNARDRIQLPAAAKAAPPVPPGADLGISELSPYVTPNDDFYRIDTALQVPQIQQDAWSLTITGMVEEEVTLTFAELAALPLVEHLTTLTCVSNEVGGSLAGNALWLGYPIRELLARARPKAGADMVLSVSEDSWTAGTPLSALTDPEREALLAIGMNGAPLPLEHGFPARMVVPGLYGYVSATKWVRELRVTTFAADQGYWTPLGWSALGPIKIASRIDVPTKSTVDAGPVVVAGVAWAQHTGIATVELQIDGGAWVPTQLAETTGPDTWRQWRYEWPATEGNHTIAVRATDSAGKVQEAAFAPPAPDGATGYHQISVKAR